MEIHFDKEYLQQLYEEGKTKDKKYQYFGKFLPIN